MTGIQLKIERADKHIENLDTAIHTFINSNPYTVGCKRDPNTRRPVYYVVKARPVPAQAALIAGDALQNLRTALDYLVCALIRANGGSDKTAAFPVMAREPVTSEEKTRFESKIEGMRDNGKDLIRQIKPYKGGDEALWQLHRLNNTDKHRLLFAVGSAFRAFDMGAVMTRDLRGVVPPTVVVPKIDFWLAPKDRTFPLKTNDELFIDMPEAKPNKDIKFAFEVALNETGIVAGEPLLVVVQKIRQRVFNVVAMFNGMY